MFDKIFERSALINKSFFGRLTPAESIELDQWLLESGNREWFEGLQDPDWPFKVSEAFTPRDSKETFARLQERINGA